VITSITEGTSADVDVAVTAARKAFETVWGLKTDGAARGRLLLKLADLVEQHADNLAATETLANGFRYLASRYGLVQSAVSALRYYAGWADKNHGKVMEVHTE
jgi:aldehyde dehydrogenase (NAD+)